MNLKLIEKLLADQPGYRLTQVKKAIFNDFVSNWDEVTTLPKELREKLKVESPLTIDSNLSKSINENTVKALINLEDGLSIETVLMKHNNRNTVCVSSQVGCPLNCSFCATGKMGFKRNLEMSEIIEQILFFSRMLKKHGEKVTNVVFMGMGEPFLNYDNVVGSIRYLNDKDTMHLGMRHFSVSTSGIPEKIKTFANENFEANLAVSLHAADDTLRSKLMPVNNTYPLKKVINALHYYQDKTNRKIMFEYIMIDKLNDNESDAKKLTDLAKEFICMINLIPYNPSKNSMYKPSATARIKKFKAILEKAKVNVVQRFTLGREIDAACGQLAKRSQQQ
jgi:23S rRNA (adenine2503-C2)-methyltransferase